jgi:hypothetical protein
MQALFTMKYIEVIHQSQLHFLFSEFSTLYGLFLPIWPSGSTQYIQNTWDEISNVKFYKKKLDLIFT